MDLSKLFSIFVFFIVLGTIEEALGHPKSWLTTTKKPKSRSGKSQRSKRSVTESGVTYYPGLTSEYKDSLRYEELGKFLREEEQGETEGEEEIILRLLQEEKDSTTDEPIEFAVQKRVIMQLKRPQVRPVEEMINIVEIPQRIFELNAPLIPLEHFEYDFGEPKKDTTQIEMDHQRRKQGGIYDYPIPTVEQNPPIDTINQAVLNRLFIDDTNSQSVDTEGKFQETQSNPSTTPQVLLVQPNSFNLIPNIRQYQRTKDHESRHTSLLNQMLRNQQKIRKKDLDFLTGNEESVTTQSTDTTGETLNGFMEITDGNDAYHISSQSNSEETSDVGDLYYGLSQAELDWEETHEYDA